MTKLKALSLSLSLSPSFLCVCVRAAKSIGKVQHLCVRQPCRRSAEVWPALSRDRTVLPKICSWGWSNQLYEQKQSHCSDKYRENYTVSNRSEICVQPLFSCRDLVLGPMTLKLESDLGSQKMPFLTKNEYAKSDHSKVELNWKVQQ